uniref:Uncharacterized protein n=1 Tax=Magallana gigas TaxID=29159 RepID=A0A8W8IAJ8_MAGGI
MVKANTSTYKGLIVYPTYGYYLSPNFDHSLDVSITTYVETNTSEYSSFYRVQPRPMLGQNYTISMVSDSSSEYECAILAPIDQQLHIIVTLPPDLLYKVLLYDETLKETQTNYTVPKGMDMALRTTNEVCVLISKFRDLFVNNTILKSHVEMIFSQDNPPRKPSALTTTQKLEPTKVSTLMNKNSQSITTADTEYCAEFRQDIVSQAEVTSKLNHLRSKLSVNKSSLTSFVRQKTCAVDERTSARNIGYVGVLVILMCSMLIISCDLITLFQLVRKV